MTEDKILFSTDEKFNLVKYKKLIYDDIENILKDKTIKIKEDLQKIIKKINNIYHVSDELVIYKSSSNYSFITAYELYLIFLNHKNLNHYWDYCNFYNNPANHQLFIDFYNYAIDKDLSEIEDGNIDKFIIQGNYITSYKDYLKFFFTELNDKGYYHSHISSKSIINNQKNPEVRKDVFQSIVGKLSPFPDTSSSSLFTLIEVLIADNSFKFSLDYFTVTDITNNENNPFPHNRIIFGAPGTGKSYRLKEDIQKFNIINNNFERVTFYPTYNYANFIGSYKPKPVYKINERFKEPFIDYQFVPGPMSRILKKALEDKENKYVLLIEEINRADASAVFGDFFQLLDRDSKGDSQYAIDASEEIKGYLNRDKISLPSNLYIWATMNSSDQGVQPLDTAFKRRWSIEYISLDSGEDIIADFGTFKYFNRDTTWNDFRKRLNKKIKEQDGNISEDRLLGPFFITKKEIENKTFKTKIIAYLKEDLFRYADYLKDYTINDLEEKFNNTNIFNIEIDNINE